MDGMQPCILYVEDDSRSRRVMQMMLESMELSNISIFEDSTDFLARAESINPKPDVIFLDIHVLPYSGFEMLEMIRKSTHFEDQIVVALTASVMNEEVTKLKEAGFNGCLAKPIDSDTFPGALTLILKREEVWYVIL